MNDKKLPLSWLFWTLVVWNLLLWQLSLAVLSGTGTVSDEEGGILGEPELWMGYVIPIVVLIAVSIVFLKIAIRLLRPLHGMGSPSRWPPALRWGGTVVFGGSIFVFQGSLLGDLAEGASLASVESFTRVVATLGAAIGILRLWLEKLEPDQGRPLATTGATVIDDERHQAILGRSAVTALCSTLLLVAVVGGIYDLFIQKTWPLRALVESGAALGVWYVAYRYWNARA